MCFAFFNLIHSVSVAFSHVKMLFQLIGAPAVPYQWPARRPGEGKKQMDTITEKIERLKAKERQRQQESDREKEERRARHERDRALFNETVSPYLGTATAKDYGAWLKGFMERGGEPTTFYDYGMPQSKYYLATDSFKLPPLYGADSVCIIIPAGVTVTFDDLGHNSLYMIDGFDYCGYSVPVYEGLEF